MVIKLPLLYPWLTYNAACVGDTEVFVGYALQNTKTKDVQETPKWLVGEVRLGRQWQHHSRDKPHFSSTETVQHSIWWVVLLVWHMWAASTTWVVKKYEWLQHAGYIVSNSTLTHVSPFPLVLIHTTDALYLRTDRCAQSSPCTESLKLRVYQKEPNSLL